ncbi:hypothetical protein PLICRDRAFT_180797 [Plicaturopsis crispa FD-325 SS-3]|uniref:Thiaminase-2/PQQC domain-containing protein n=1 Tax=Plicaturopsis crispa FD-325 SS-3 TaxID=944288 RepID=A0A0C9T4J0_PLICR|nr:hypothetical protein PLICRDRAFT_180797 [Plicaturopsis crispa FD-325 SS-3]
MSVVVSEDPPSGQDSLDLRHFVRRPIPLPTKEVPRPFTQYLLDYAPDTWRQYIHHPFITRLARGDLPLKSFLHFITQDYHYLKHYARVFALGVYKSDTIQQITANTEMISSTLEETALHVKYCETHGISLQQLLSTPESLANVAYSRWLIDTGLRGDSLDLQVATTPCLIGYGLIGARLLVATEGVDKSEQNPYWSWIAQYGNPKFQAAVQTGTDTLETLALDSSLSAARLQHVVQIFVRAVELEIAFWDEAMAANDK